MPYTSTLNSNSEPISNHRPYHEVCGHVYLEITKKNSQILNELLKNCADDYHDGRFEAMTGLVDTLENCIKLAQDLFSYGGNQANIWKRYCSLTSQFCHGQNANWTLFVSRAVQNEWTNSLVG